MSRAYSLDLRERVVASMRGGLSSYEAAAHYQVSQSSAQRWFNRALAQGSPAALRVGGRRGFLLADKLEWITRRLAEAPDTTSPNSKHCSAKPQPEPSKTHGKALAFSSAHSHQKNAQITSEIPGMRQFDNIRL